MTSLFHDLGHLPLSHDFELSLDAISREPNLPAPVKERIINLFQGLEGVEADKFHELVGPEVGPLILRDLLAKHQDEPREHFYHAVFNVAYDIWTAEEPHDLDPEATRDGRRLALACLRG